MQLLPSSSPAVTDYLKKRTPVSGEASDTDLRDEFRLTFFGLLKQREAP